MDRLIEKLDRAEQALRRFQDVLVIPSADVTDIVRDPAILRFTFAVETSWKAARAVPFALEGTERVPSGQPKATVRESVVAGWLTPEEGEAALYMMLDRNLTVHTYDEEQARALFSRLPEHAELLSRWQAAMRASLDTRTGLS